jgi:hypothetical protein
MAKVRLNVGKCKGHLLEGIKNLRNTLKDPALPKEERGKYKRAIFDMKFAHMLLDKIPCVQPDMSFEFPPGKPNGHPNSRTRRRRR